MLGVAGELCFAEDQRGKVVKDMETMGHIRVKDQQNKNYRKSERNIEPKSRQNVGQKERTIINRSS